MASGTLSNAYRGWTYRINWSSVPSVADNQSEVTCVHQLVCASGYGLNIGTRSNSCTVGGGAKSFTSPKINTSGGTTITLGTTKHTVTHNDDGSKSVAVSGVFNIEATLSGTYKKSITVSGSITLDTIPRASQPSCVTWPEHTQNVGSFGDTISIHMNRNADVFTHRVRYAFGSKTGTIATGVETGTTWTIPLSLMDLIPNSTSGSGTIYVDTYNGSTLIGTKSCGFTATVPTSVKPSCSLTLEDTTGVDDIYGSPVQGLSRIKVKVNTTPAYSSPISSYALSIDGESYTIAEATTGALKTAGSSVVKATVKDRRGRSGTASYTMQVQAYTPPQVSKLTVHRCDADGTENDQGKYVKVIFSAAITSLGSKNTAAYALRYKKSSATSWTTATLSGVSGVYSVTNKTHIFAADESSPYDVEVTATDRHGSATRTTSASTAFSLIDFHPSGTGVRFGGVAQEEYTLQNDLNLHQVGNTYAYQPGAFNGEKGYTLLALITLNTLNVNAPIVFEINRRGALCPMRVYVRFASSSTSVDPDLGSITYEGDNYGAFLVRAAASTWKLYVDNTGGWSNPCLQTWYTTDNQNSRISVEFPSEQVETLPTPYYRATPAVLRSILDAFMPVGFVLTLYSHADPNTMYPGTTWVRISNAFLWAVDGSGDIGLTGGEKTHTLTVAELPSHAHGAVYSGSNPAEKTHSWLASGGSNMAYGSIAVGGGQAHNNMPPYVQVSIWRRTA